MKNVTFVLMFVFISLGVEAFTIKQCEFTFQNIPAKICGIKSETFSSGVSLNNCSGAVATSEKNCPKAFRIAFFNENPGLHPLIKKPSRVNNGTCWGYARQKHTRSCEKFGVTSRIYNTCANPVNGQAGFKACTLPKIKKDIASIEKAINKYNKNLQSKQNKLLNISKAGARTILLSGINKQKEILKQYQNMKRIIVKRKNNDDFIKILEEVSIKAEETVSLMSSMAPFISELDSTYSSLSDIDDESIEVFKSDLIEKVQNSNSTDGIRLAFFQSRQLDNLKLVKKWGTELKQLERELFDHLRSGNSNPKFSDLLFNDAVFLYNFTKVKNINSDGVKEDTEQIVDNIESTIKKYSEQNISGIFQDS
jgi:hypothetical protein